MDYTALTESQQQQQAAAAAYQHPQPHQDQNQQSSQPYDPTQIHSQPYDQSYYSYYQNAQYQYPQHQPYPYYAPDYSNPSSQPEPNLQPPGISGPTDPGPQPAVSVPQSGYYPPEQQQNGYYPPEQQNAYAAPVEPGLNPAAAAAVAALSQLQQFAGSMDAAERAMAMQERQQWQPNNGGYTQMGGPPPPGHHGGPPFRPPVGGLPYRSGGRRGGRSFRGGGRSNFGPYPSRSDSGSPHFRGRGRMGRGGGGRRFPHSGSAPSHPKHGVDPSAGPTPEDAAPAQTEVPAAQPAPSRRAPQVFWCELCVVDCNTYEILEQHLNGKRHKKNVQRLQEFENHKKMMAEIQQKAVVPEHLQLQPQPQSQPQPQPQPQAHAQAQHEKEVNTGAQEENNKPFSVATESLPPTDETVKIGTESEQQNQAGNQTEEPKAEATAETSATPAKRPMRGRNNWEDRRRAPKRGKTWMGRGTKRMRMPDRVMDKEPKEVEEPKFCALCNVTCDTQAVFECHLAGKKHNSRVKHSQGPVGSYGLHSYYLSHPHPSGYVPRGYHQPIIYGHQGQEMVKEPPAGAQSSVTESHAEKNLEPSQGQETVTEAGSKESSIVKPESQSEFTVDPSKDVVEHSDQILKEVNPAPPNHKIVEEYGIDTVMLSEFVPSALQVTVPATEYGDHSIDNLVFPGLEVQVTEPGLNTVMINQDTSLQ